MTSPAVTRPTTAAPATTGRPTPSSLGPLRLNYRGITKLVVVKSVLNDTPAGRAAIDAVAVYYSTLATATTDHSIDPARRLASASCTQCKSDVNRIAGYIQRNQRVTRNDGSQNRWISAVIFVESVSPLGRVRIQFDGQQSAVRLTGSDGEVLDKDSTTYISDLDVLQVDGGRALIVDQVARS